MTDQVKQYHYDRQLALINLLYNYLNLVFNVSYSSYIYLPVYTKCFTINVQELYIKLLHHHNNDIITEHIDYISYLIKWHKLFAIKVILVELFVYLIGSSQLNLTNLHLLGYVGSLIFYYHYDSCSKITKTYFTQKKEITKTYVTIICFKRSKDERYQLLFTSIELMINE